MLLEDERRQEVVVDEILEGVFAAGVVSDPVTALRGLAPIERGEYVAAM